MNTLTRLKDRWLDQKPKQGRNLSPNSEQQISIPPSPSQKLCRRCRQLRLQSHIDNPWAVSEAESATGFKIGTIEEKSFHKSCSLCSQLLLLLRNPALLENKGERDGGFGLWCRHIQDKTFKSTYFSISYSDSQQEMFLFATQALFVQKDIDGIDGLPRKNPYYRTRTDPARARTSFGRSLDSKSPDYGQLTGWIGSCKSQHKRTCGAWNSSSITPKRLIDCQQRQLCTNVMQPYVCLSYTWGVSAIGSENSGTKLPVNLPQTVSDAMTVTLNIGMRYLWIDRYCIEQDNAAEKHDVIRNMDAICKYSFDFTIHKGGLRYHLSKTPPFTR
jgi:hypothetical protein